MIVPKIDIHVHTRLFRSGLNRLNGSPPYPTAEEMRQMYAKIGVEKGVIMGRSEPECCHQQYTNEEIMYYTTLRPDLFYWFCSIDPRIGKNAPDTDFSHYLNYFKAKGAKGLGEICANFYLDDPVIDHLFYHCEKCDMPVTFHLATQIGGTYGLVDDLHLPRLERALQKYPKLKFFGHSQVFWSEISADVTEENRGGYPKGKVIPGRVVELFEKYDNLYGDLSAFSGYNAVSRDSEFGYAFMEQFQDRLFFGTDITSVKVGCPLSGYLDNAVEKGLLSQQAYEKICRDNAIRVLKLE